MTMFKIDIISDTVCPWVLQLQLAILARGGLDQAIADYTKAHKDREDEFLVTWKPFYLNPNAGKSIDKRQHYANKFGPEKVDAIWGYMNSVGQSEGIPFKFGGKVGSTRDSHRLMQLAQTKSPAVQAEVAQQLFKAYFENEQDITSHSVLTAAGVRAGLDESEVEQMLSTDAFGSTVDEEVARNASEGVRSVPHYTLQNQFRLSGAQDPADFQKIFESIVSREL